MAGRPLEYQPRPGASDEVNQLRQALIELVNRTGTKLAAIAESENIRGGLRTLSRQLNQDRGPDKHIVLTIVEHCARLAGQPSDQLAGGFTELWSAAQGDQGGSARPRALAGAPPPEPPAPEPPDPALVEPVLELVADGDDIVAAAVITGDYPEAGPTAGGIIAEIGRRIPDGAAGLLAAIIDRGGYDFARAYMESFSQADEETAARVLADPRLQPPPADEPPADEPPGGTSVPASILDKDPADILGRRRAAKVRQGDVVQVAADIIQEAEFEPLPSGIDIAAEDDYITELIRAERRLRRRKAKSGSWYDIQRATSLVLDVARNAKEEAAQVLGRLLNALAAGGHIELVARVLAEVADAAGDGTGELLDAMSPHVLVEALKLLAWDDGLHEFQSQAPSLMVQARPLVLAQLLLERERRDSQTPAVDFLQLRQARQVLAEMLSQDARLTFSLIEKKIKLQGILGLAELTPEETSLIACIRDLPPANRHTAGQLLGRLLQLDIWGGSRFVFYLAAGSQDNDILWMAAEMLATAIRLNPNVSDYIISLMLKENDRASIDVLLDHLAEKHPDQGNEVVKAMLARTEQGGIATWLRKLLRNGALELAGEMLRQATESDPNGSWNLVAHAVEDGNLEAALSILEHIA